MNTILFLLHPGFEELEAVGPIDILRRSGLEVVLASTSDQLNLEGRNGIVLTADTLLSDIENPLSFEAIVVPGGPGVMELRKTPKIAELLKQFADSGKPTAAICAAPLLLKDAGLLTSDTQIAAHFTCQKEIPNLGAGDAIAFGLALAARFTGRDKAIEVAESICLSAEDVL
jgi:4-methyl-5(b-hydroxyethyl)-thiazole monophosphate biosynthesis